MLRRVAVVLNPAASHGAALRVRPRVEAALRRLGLEFHVAVTEGRGHAAKLAAQAAAEGGEAILVVGGDGTVHEVANGLLDGAATPPPIAVVPVGTGNDFYRMVGAPREVNGAVAVLRSGALRRFDVGRARWSGTSRYFVNLLGVGIDAAVLRHRGLFLPLPGAAHYLGALLAALVRFQPVPLRVRMDGGEKLESRAMIAAITVGPTAGGGLRLTPDASPEDGQFDLCFIEEVRGLRIARILPKVVRGRHAGLREVHLRRFRAATVESPTGEPFPFELDGELADAPVSRLQVELLPGRLPVLVPGRGAA